MSTSAPHSSQTRSAQGGFVRTLVLIVALLLGLVAAYTWAALNWAYSSGERVGYLQKLSHKGLLCKTYEGELLLVAVPGQAPEKFHFTVRDEALPGEMNRLMGQRISLSYEQHVGIPSSCFGETQYYATKVHQVAEMGQSSLPPTAAPAASAPPAALPAPTKP